MKIAIVGATGEVGRMMINYLQELSWKQSTLDLFASARSAGQTLYCLDQAIQVQELKEKPLHKAYDYVFFAAGGSVASKYAPIAAKYSELVIDNSSAFRREEGIPLVVPQINSDLLKGYKGIVANPNCSTIQILLPLGVLDEAYDLKKVIVSTYQAVSGSGHKGIQALEEQRGGSTDKGIYPETIDLNVIPQIGAFLDSGYSSEEEKMHLESRKILRKESLQMSVTTVRVPVIYGHSISVYAEFEQEIDMREARRVLSEADGIKFHENRYITPLDLGNSNDSHVSRLRYGVDRYSLNFWNVGHNVRIGAATNAVNIMRKHQEYKGLG